MSEFEKELDAKIKSGEIMEERYKNGCIVSYFASFKDIVSTFKDWQPPKRLVVVPRAVANFIEDGRGKLKLHDAFNKIEVDYGPGTQLYDWVFKLSCGQILFARAWIDDYTVAKEQLYTLKHIDLSEQYKNESVYLSHSRYGKLKHETFTKGSDMSESERCHFTQSEINKIHIGSYEQIEVKVDE